MAGFMDMLNKRPESENISAYQKNIMKDIVRKLTELEEQNDQNAAAIDEIKRLQKMILQKVEAVDVAAPADPYQAAEPSVYAGDALVEELRKQVEVLESQMKANRKSLDEKLQSILDLMNEETEDDTDAMESKILDKLDTVKLSIEDTVHKENIKCYRNVQGAIEEQGDVKEYDVKGLKKFLKVVVWFQLMTIALLVLRILGLL